MKKPHLAQALCGPARHCIMGVAYTPGMTAAEAGAVGDVVLDPQSAGRYLAETVDALIGMTAINPWCEICRSPRARWVFEDAALPFASLDEARPYLMQSQADQMETNRTFRSSRG